MGSSRSVTSALIWVIALGTLLLPPTHNYFSGLL